MAFTITRTVLAGAGKKLDAVVAAGRAVQRAGQDQLVAGIGLSGGEQREVLQVVGASVSVARIVGGHTCRAEVDANEGVGVDRIAQHSVSAAVDDIDATAGVVGNQVTGPGRRATNGVIGRAALHLHTVAQAVAAVQAAASIGADVIALHNIVRGVDLDTFPVHRDHVALCGRCATNRVARARDDRQAHIGVAAAGRAIGVQTDGVALDDMVGRPRADDGDAFVTAVGDDVAQDQRIRARDVDAVVAVAHPTVADTGGAGTCAADPVVGNRHAVGTRRDIDTVDRETRDHQPLDRAAAASGPDAQAAETRGGTVDPHHRRAGVVGLAGGVDGDCAGDAGQRTRYVDHIWPGASDVEDDLVGRAAVGGVVGRCDGLAQADAAVGATGIGQVADGGDGAVRGVADGVNDDHAAGRGDDVQREFRRAAVIAAAQVHRGGGRHPVLVIDPGIGQGGVDGGIARAIGGDVDETKVTLGFAIPCAVGLAGPGAKKFNAVAGAGVGIETAHDGGACTRHRGAGEHREVLQAVGARVNVVGVIGRDAIGAQVDAQAGVAVDAVAQHRHRGAGRHKDAVTGVEGNRVALAGRGATNARVVGRAAVANQDAVAAVAQCAAAVGSGADEVAADDGAGAGACITQVDAVAGVAADQVVQHLVVERGVVDVDTVVVVAEVDASGRVGTDVVVADGVVVGAARQATVLYAV